MNSVSDSVVFSQFDPAVPEMGFGHIPSFSGIQGVNGLERRKTVIKYQIQNQFKPLVIKMGNMMKLWTNKAQKCQAIKNEEYLMFY